MKQRLFTLRIIHGALMAGPGIFLAVAYLTSPRDGTSSMLTTIALVFCLCAVAVAYFIVAIMSKNADAGEYFGIKFQRYFAAKIIQWAILESAAFLNGTAYYINGSMTNFFVAIALIAAILILPPRTREFADKFKVSDAELRSHEG